MKHISQPSSSASLRLQSALLSQITAANDVYDRSHLLLLCGSVSAVKYVSKCDQDGDGAPVYSFQFKEGILRTYGDRKCRFNTGCCAAREWQIFSTIKKTPPSITCATPLSQTSSSLSPNVHALKGCNKGDKCLEETQHIFHSNERSHC